MKNKLKKLSLFLLILFTFSIVNVFGKTEIKKISIDAKINDDGSLDITEVWQANSDNGTEFYIPKQNMRDMTIENFKVSDENGPYKEMKPWDVDKTLEEKSGKFGINESGSGPELCFGKSEYNKDKTYTLTYKMTNAVQAFSDYDGFNIRFVNDKMDPASNDIFIKIYRDGTELSDKNAGIWAFGFKGSINFLGGQIIGSNSEKFFSRNNLTVLLRLDKGIINPISSGSGTFEKMREMAFEGSSYDNSKSDGLLGFLRNLKGSSPLLIVAVLFTPLVCILIFLFLFVTLISMLTSSQYRSLKKLDYKREIPQNGSLLLNHFFHLFNRKNAITGLNISYLISADFLKWMKDDAVLFEAGDENGKGRAKEDKMIFVSEPKYDCVFEEKLFKFLKDVSKDDVLDERDFNYSFRRRYSIYKNMMEAFDKEMIRTTKEMGFATGSKEKMSKIKLTDKGKKARDESLSFKKYLKDFILIDEKYPKEVELWCDYLIMAALFGLGDQVMDEIKDINPAYHFTNTDNYSSTYMAYSISDNFASRISTAMGGSSSSSSSGGGGSLSFGGGGFSGGGSGGGSR
ncbi:DUF2207 domain-containing protein [uncultured Peptoniphilus sp.]|uniref:DUF2207 family protein n=2 Tax=Peptoniphilus TaxID=162289 RepID=UPI00280595E2|nr:DUF2207 domain-containing protein [uncultured Peptoniphilus sp.]